MYGRPALIPVVERKNYVINSEKSVASLARILPVETRENVFLDFQGIVKTGRGVNTSVSPGALIRRRTSP